MRKDTDLLDIVQTALGTFDHRQSFTPGMFDPLKPLFRKLGYKNAAVYMTDDYPDRMHAVCLVGDEKLFSPCIALNRQESLYLEFENATRKIPGVMTESLFSHGRLLGAIAATHDDPADQKVQEAFAVLARSLSVMAYVEYIRTNSYRERMERDVFFAQSLTNRLLLREPPKMREFRLGFEFIRSLDAGGDFFDLVPDAEGGLYGCIGSCNGQGLRTVLEVCDILRTIHRSQYSAQTLSDVLRAVNELLVRDHHRAHQASLAVFRVDVRRQKLLLSKSGRLGLLVGGPGTQIDVLSSRGTTFLGMMETPDLTDEEYDFVPGQSLFAVTEGFYSAHNFLNARPQIHWFLESVAEILAARSRKPLANAIFDAVNRDVDHTARPDHSMLALSVEYRGKNRDSVRMSARQNV